MPLFSHITVGSNDLELACRFYDSVLMPLGLCRRAVIPDGGPSSACWIEPGQTLPRFYVYSPYNQQPANPGNGSMVAFCAPSTQVVIAAFEAGLAAGGSSEGEPGTRPNYGSDYFGAYLRDPDGNKIHIVHRNWKAA
jgi:catechol 2,3-dioxygenase-like lactoylglutathione lyase family enzyme